MGIDTAVMIQKMGNATFEIATVELDGKKFTAMGSMVDEDKGYVVGYCNDRMDKVLTWGGKDLGSLRVLSKWKAPLRCFTTNWFYSVRAVINGKIYSGRTNGMLVRLKRLKNQRRKT